MYKYAVSFWEVACLSVCFLFVRVRLQELQINAIRDVDQKTTINKVSGDTPEEQEQ